MITRGARLSSACVTNSDSSDRERILQLERFDESLSRVDVVLDTIGGAIQERSLRVLKADGILVSIVSAVPEAAQKEYGVRAAFFYAEVTTARLNKITELIDGGQLSTDVGTVLPLEQAQTAYEMLGGAKHKRGKIVLAIHCMPDRRLTRQCNARLPSVHRNEWTNLESS